MRSTLAGGIIGFEQDWRCTMKVEYHVEVDSTAEKLWDILTDVKAWPEWQGTSYIEPPSGPLQKGSTFVAELGGHKWNLTVREADRPKRLVWVGRQMGLEAIHECEFVETGGKIQAISRESMSGWMLLFIHSMVRTGSPRLMRSGLLTSNPKRRGVWPSQPTVR
jgi:uncharacterized protein YndB with AHSA1/START domain